MIATLLIIAALICFFLAAIGAPSRVGLVPLGLMLWLIVDTWGGRLP